MGGYIAPPGAGRAWASRRSADRRAEQQRRIGSAGPASVCRRYSPDGQLDPVTRKAKTFIEVAEEVD